MVIVKVKDKEFYMDGYLKKNLDFVKPRLSQRNEMHVGIIDGRVGTGKSTLIDQICYYCADGNFSLDDKSFTVKQFANLLDNTQKGTIDNNKLLDEAFELNKRTTQSKANAKMLRQLQRIRSKNKWIWIVLPCVYDLDKNIILQMANLFIHCYTDYDFGPKGKFALYDRHKLKKLWLYCRDSLSYSTKVAWPNFRGRFSGAFLSGDYDTYEKKKNKDLDDADKIVEESTTSKYIEQRDNAIISLYNNGMPVKDIAKNFAMKETTIYYNLQKKGYKKTE